jgi:SAM-dependent methyltransferase
VTALPAPAATVVNDNSSNSAVYYSYQYWNDLPQVVAYMSENFTGHPGKWWVDDFKERFCQTPLARVLVLNCGNGWVERELVDKGMALAVTAFDYSADLLRAAMEARDRRPIHYVRADANTVSFAPEAFDAVFNVAALHHVQYLNRLCRELCQSLKPTGVLVNFDYIGPHRNQYSRAHWRRIVRANRQLPAEVRKARLLRPHLPSLLKSDPTEAIHSDLILPVVGRYFDIVERHDTGGGIAYEILTHNPAVHTLGPERADLHIRRILAWDRHDTIRGLVPPLYSYFLAYPRPAVLRDAAALQAFQEDEDRREARSRAWGGVYSLRHRLLMTRHAVHCRLFNSRLRRFVPSPCP